MAGVMLAVGGVSGSAQQSCRCIQWLQCMGGLAVWPSARGRAVSRSRTSAAALCGG